MNKKEFSIFEAEGFSVDKIVTLLTALHQTQLAQDLKHTGIEKYLSVLIVLDIINNGCSQKLLAEILHIDMPTMEDIADELVQKGFINRFPSKDNWREYVILLTDKAKEYVPEIKDIIYRENKSKKNKHFTGEEKTEFKKNKSEFSKNI